MLNIGWLCLVIRIIADSTFGGGVKAPLLTLRMISALPYTSTAKDSKEVSVLTIFSATSF